MKNGILAFIIALFALKGNAQVNLVPNYSFEDTVHCPNNQGQLEYAQYWINPTGGTPDYFNACSTAGGVIAHVPNNGFGAQNAHTGVAYAGFYAFNKGFPNIYREYIQVHLTNSLVTNHKYTVSFYLSLADVAQYADDNIGAYFSTNQISSSTSNVLATYTPQIQSKPTQILNDKVNWMLVSDTLTAQGGEQYITIGNFVKDSLSDTLFLGNSGGGNVTYYYIDDVSVIDLATTGIAQISSGNIQVSIYPNPASSVLNVEVTTPNENPNANITITDMLGNMVKQLAVSSKQLSINVANLSEGVYQLSIQGSNFSITKKLVIVK